MTFNHYGKLECKNWNTGDKCDVEMSPCTGFFMKEHDKAKIIGHCYSSKGGAPKYRI